MADTQERAYAKVVAKAWADESFKRELMANPAKVLRENGFDVPPGMPIYIADGSCSWGFPLPPKPSDAVIDPDNIQLGYCSSSSNFCCS
jgi:hypothetical protein